MDVNKEKIKRFTSGKFSFNDYLTVLSFFKEEENNDRLKASMESEWNETDHVNNNREGLSRILENLHLQINMSSDGTVSHNFYHAFSKVAVALFIPALIIIAIFSYLSINSYEKSESWAEIQSPVGSRTRFQLPDGTQGWLNGGSSIKYPINFKKHRSVEVSGEAWFDVVHLKSEEFRVITPYFDVEVLGTQFNVIAYREETTAEIILERGKVLVLGKDREVKEELEPDQHLIYNKSTKTIIKAGIDSKSYTRWKDGLLIFKNVPMSEIAKRLERRYNVEIILHGDSLKSSIFRATFKDESLEEICRMLSTVAPIKCKIHDREKQEDDTYAKIKIEMWKKM